MYIDYHYYMIKALAYFAGFSKSEAEDIAYASEYVDDALEYREMRILNAPPGSPLMLNNGKFDVVCTAHDEQTMLAGALKNGQGRTYVPFHFVPRGDVGGVFDYRTTPDAPIIRDYVGKTALEVAAATGEARTFALIKLGVALHTYADTWAHSDFSGRFEPLDNSVVNLQTVSDSGDLTSVAIDFMPSVVPECGHAKAHAYPDSSHTHWVYYNGETREYFEHDNPRLYMAASEKIYRVLLTAAGGPDRWAEIKDRVRDCIEYTPSQHIWHAEGRGLVEKIKRYINAFPEVYRWDEGEDKKSCPFLPRDDKYDHLKDEFKIYNELKWKYDALKVYSVENGDRKELSFTDAMFDVRNEVSRPFLALADEIGKINLKDFAKDLIKAGFESVIKSAVGSITRIFSSSSTPSPSDVLRAEAEKLVEKHLPNLEKCIKNLSNWLHQLDALEYECLGHRGEAVKWFYFHHAAHLQRQAVLAACPDDMPGKQPVPLMDDVSVANLAPQIKNCLINWITKDSWFTPAKDVQGKYRWKIITLHNNSDYPLQWRGHYEKDFSGEGRHGRYWTRPDRGGDIPPKSQRTFSACERDNAITGCAGVTTFAVNLPGLGEKLFWVGFSSPLVDHPKSILPNRHAKPNVATFSGSESAYGDLDEYGHQSGYQSRDLGAGYTGELSWDPGSNGKISFNIRRQ